METLIRPMDRAELRLFLFCLAASFGLHVLFAWALLPREVEEKPSEVPRIAERFARAVNTATDLDGRAKARMDEAMSNLPTRAWSRTEMADTLQWLASDLGLQVRDCDVVRALDPERSREGRWDIRAWLEWEEGSTTADLLTLAYLIGEGTLKSDFGSHRFWVHLEAEDGTGRVAFETMDCRLYRAGKLAASDLLHRASWWDQ